MAAGPFVLYHVFAEELGKKTLNLSATDVLKVALFTSTHTPSASADVSFSALSNQVSGNGYTAGGNTLAYDSSTRWSETSGVATLDADNSVFTAASGDIVARYAVLYDSTPATNNLIGYFLLDDTPADVTATDGNTLTIEWNASGILTIDVT